MRGEFLNAIYPHSVLNDTNKALPFNFKASESIVK